MRFKISILMMAAMLLAATVHAHHAAAPIFDQDREVQVKGVVKTWRFVNPHPLLLIEVKDEKGQRWSGVCTSGRYIAEQTRLVGPYVQSR